MVQVVPPLEVVIIEPPLPPAQQWVVSGHETPLIGMLSGSVCVAQLVPLAFISIMAMALPNIGGWGPREGVTAWAFSAAGLGAGLGAATAVAYGILVLAASLPGGLVLLLERLPYRHVIRAPR